MNAEICLHGKVSIDKIVTSISGIKNGKVYLKTPPLGDDIYKLRYTKPSTYNGNVNRTSSKVTLNIEKPNPNDRT